MMDIMRYPPGHKEAVRERIVAGAATGLRERGLSGLGIPALMRRAGLTHGGFYAHFKDRDDLIAEAIEAAGAETAAGPFAEGVPLADALAAYLSPEHLSDPAGGCVVAALGAEGPRQRSKVRKAFGRVARGLIDLVDRKVRRHPGSGGPSDEALRLTATMVGAVVLGRLVDDPELARRVLAVARTT